MDSECFSNVYNSAVELKCIIMGVFLELINVRYVAYCEIDIHLSFKIGGLRTEEIISNELF